MLRSAAEMPESPAADTQDAAHVATSSQQEQDAARDEATPLAQVGRVVWNDQVQALAAQGSAPPLHAQPPSATRAYGVQTAQLESAQLQSAQPPLHSDVLAHDPAYGRSDVVAAPRSDKTSRSGAAHAAVAQAHSLAPEPCSAPNPERISTAAAAVAQASADPALPTAQHGDKVAVSLTASGDGNAELELLEGAGARAASHAHGAAAAPELGGHAHAPAERASDGRCATRSITGLSGAADVVSGELVAHRSRLSARPKSPLASPRGEGTSNQEGGQHAAVSPGAYRKHCKPKAV